jgi:hypothetical protein
VARRRDPFFSIVNDAMIQRINGSMTQSAPVQTILRRHVLSMVNESMTQ